MRAATSASPRTRGGTCWNSSRVPPDNPCTSCSSASTPSSSLRRPTRLRRFSASMVFNGRTCCSLETGVASTATRMGCSCSAPSTGGPPLRTAISCASVGHPEIEPDFAREAPRIRVLRLDLNDAELRLAYAGAIALVYPSRYEGFGLPVAEAMASGCPVITSAVASLPEVAGDAALYVDPDDPAELATAIDAVREPTRRATMIAAGLARAAMFDWPSSAANCASLLGDAMLSEAPSDRDSRAAVWQTRREAQAQLQAVRRATRPRQRSTEGPREALFLTQLKTVALRYLPPWATRQLRSAKAALANRRPASR